MINSLTNFFVSALKILERQARLL